MSDLLAHLNSNQKEGVENPHGPCLIIAGAGSGKTRVLTYRIAYLMEEGVDPFRILSLTFTNKAAKEMRERIHKLVGDEARSLWMGTFHSLFSRILRIESQHIGYTSDFTIYDTTDSKSVIKEVVKTLGLDDKVYNPNVVLNRISSAKNRLISWQEYNRNPVYFEQDRKLQKPEMGRVYQRYSELCKRSNAMDFDDLLFNTNVLFRDNPEVLAKYQRKFSHVLIDEFQDTNYSQYLIVKQLSAVHKNICAVGDDAQSIYAFRGADIGNILNFERDYSNLRTVKLEQNYRSTQMIVNIANGVIANNTKQIKKNVWTKNVEGDKIGLVKATSDIEEGRLIATSIFEEKSHNYLSYSSFAILYRTNAQSRAMEEALRRIGIKYRIIGGLSFYQRKEIKDLVGYFRFVINSQDQEAFKRIINLPKRGIGKTTIDKILAAASQNDVSAWAVVKDFKRYVGQGRAATSIANFVMIIETMQKSIAGKNAYEAAAYVAKNSGLLKALHEDQTIEGRSRYENVQELLNAAQVFVDSSESEEKDLSAFLQEVSLLTGGDQADDDEEAVTMMTIHGAKGLEFDYVYLVGLEEELFPSARSINSRAELEEERRLFYVAITRAKQKLYFSYALQRYRFGTLRPCEPSRFLFEVNQEMLEIKNGGFGEDTMTNFARKKKEEKSSSNGYNSDVTSFSPPKRLKKIQNSAKTTQSTDSFRTSSPDEIMEAMRVEHVKFGVGVVIEIEENPSGKRAKVDFGKHGLKTLLLNFAKLKIVTEREFWI
jgi:DNA helicase-2/ATP-dependent DNA helicase PcrA